MFLVMCFKSHLLYVIVFTFSFFLGQCSSHNYLGNGATISTFSYPRVDLKPYQWRYIRVDFPQRFSTVTLSLESNVDLDPRKLEKVKKSRLPLMCLGDGSPPIPDVNNNLTSLTPPPYERFGNVQGLQRGELCYLMNKKIFLKLTNEQILPGVWYFGFFNGIGPTRTQAKMIDRGKGYSFSANISIERCLSSILGGPNCDQEINHLSCTKKHLVTKDLLDPISTGNSKNVIICSGSERKACFTNGKAKIYAVDIKDITKELTMRVKILKFKGAQVDLKCYARYGAIPSATYNDFSANISDNPLTVHFPKVGLLYISIHLVSTSNKYDRVWDSNQSVCFSLDWQILQCPPGKAGSNCMSDIYMLQSFFKKDPSTSFEEFYQPITTKVSSNMAEFPLDPFFPKEKSEIAWAYFGLNVTSHDSGRNLHVKLVSGGSKLYYQVYVRHKGLPSLNTWDYFYINSTSNAIDSPYFKHYDSSEEGVSFYVLYVREGNWNIGFRRLKPVEVTVTNQTMALISIEDCPQGCASHGTCKSRYDLSESMKYSYCSCDEDHGGFDCGVRIVSRLGCFLNEEVVKKPAGHVWQSIFLIGSNAAALLPAFWSLRQKAYAEWVVFMSSGVSSGIYHACDCGNPCLLSNDVLKFMDFWLSYMAVVSTCVYLTNLGETYKRAIDIGLAVITALIARNGATKAFNIAIIIAIGVSCLLLGLLIEFGIRYRSHSISGELRVDAINRWEAVRKWPSSLVQTFVKRVRWGFLIAAFISLVMAKFCWDYETPENYWIFHSVWHITIYTSSFLFLCSKPVPVDHEVARQQFITPRGE